MEVWKDQLLLVEGNWEDVYKAAESVRSELVRRLIEQHAVVCENGIAYWSAVPVSASSTGLFYVQNAPWWIATGIYRYAKADKALVANFKAFSTKVIEPRVKNLRSLGTAHGIRAYLIGSYRALGELWSHGARNASNKHCSQLREERDKVAKKIGQLVSARADSPRALVDQLAALTLEDHQNTNTETPNKAIETLQLILDSQSQQPQVSQIPSGVRRWWPVAGLVCVGIWQITGSWDSLVNWARHSVVDTLSDFYANWIVEPLLKIYRTIRHDPTEKVALVAKESLAADSRSLENMVVDFARDTDASLSAADLEILRQKAANGDLTPVMSVYEKQLSSLVASLVTGKLVRTLLIQVQKGKVDLEVALSGIDQLLQSQQLVFGLVAAIPSLSVVFWLTKLLLAQAYRQIYGSEATKAASERAQVVTSLSNLDSVVQQAPQPMRDVDLGLVYIHVTMIRQALRSNTVGSQQLRKVLDRLINDAKNRDTSAVLANLDRAYMRYQLR